jgi:hypothetical protein
VKKYNFLFFLLQVFVVSAFDRKVPIYTIINMQLFDMHREREMLRVKERNCSIFLLKM